MNSIKFTAVSHNKDPEHCLLSEGGHDVLIALYDWGLIYTPLEQYNLIGGYQLSRISHRSPFYRGGGGGQGEFRVGLDTLE
jgi:hypothetical protein